MGENMIQIKPHEMPPMVEATEEDIKKLEIKHKCSNRDKPIIFPRWIFIPPSYPKDYTEEGWERISDNTAELRFCPLCKEKIDINKGI